MTYTQAHEIVHITPDNIAELREDGVAGMESDLVPGCIVRRFGLLGYAEGRTMLICPAEGRVGMVAGGDPAWGDIVEPSDDPAFPRSIRFDDCDNPEQLFDCDGEPMKHYLVDDDTVGMLQRVQAVNSMDAVKEYLHLLSADADIEPVWKDNNQTGVWVLHVEEPIARQYDGKNEWPSETDILGTDLYRLHQRGE